VGLGWWGLSGLFEESDQAQQLADRRAKSEVSNILDRVGGLAEAKKDIAQLEELNVALGQQEEVLMSSWRKSNQEAIGEGKDWAKDGNKWKDMLVKYNDELLKKSGKNGDNKKVILAPNFYLGMEDYKQKSPKDDQIPGLARQLNVSKRLTDLFFESKEKVREGYPTSCTLLKLQVLSSQGGRMVDVAPSKSKPAEKGEYLRESYLMEFECSPEVLFSFIASLVQDQWFFIPMQLHLENEKENFPKRSELADLFKSSVPSESAPSDQVRGVANSASSPLVLVLAGKEKVRVELKIDYVGWKTGSPEKEPGKNKT
jgi:hypothetical protein